MKETMTPDAGVQDGGNVNDSGQATAGQDAPKSDVKTITQEELDRIIQQRLQRERKKWEQQIEEERRKAAMTEAERLKVEKEEAERKAQEAQAAANRRIIQAEAKAQALALGVRPERLEYVLRLADLSEIEVATTVSRTSRQSKRRSKRCLTTYRNFGVRRPRQKAAPNSRVAVRWIATRGVRNTSTSLNKAASCGRIRNLRPDSWKKRKRKGVDS